jgi:hypothetical protein
LALKKKHIAYCFFIATVLYIISPWVFEKKFFFNEFLALSGMLMLLYKRFRIGNDPINIYVLLLIIWGLVHMLTSLFRMDVLYYYLRNAVIWYSVFAFFSAYFLHHYLGAFFKKVRGLLKWYMGIFLFIPLTRFFYERVGMSMLFVFFFKKAGKWTLAILIILNFIYGITYSSLTAWLIASFYFLLLFAPSYRFFKQSVLLFLICFILFFIYIQPNLSLISKDFSPYNEKAILAVINSHPVLKIDPNSTWRLVLWKEVIVDHFPGNLFGIGFGTPMMTYYPVEDFAKISSLPYVLGAHNSYIYLFGRLGIVYLLITLLIYRNLFKEYYNYKEYYYQNNQVFAFWSFFAISVISLFNPTFASPLFASGYWILLGFTAKAIQDRRQFYKQTSGKWFGPVIAQT